MTTKNNILKPPDWLSGKAKAEWRLLMTNPGLRNRLGVEHRGLLAEYCSAMAAVGEAELALRGQPKVIAGVNGGEHINPKHNVMTSAYRRMTTAASKLGFSKAKPASKTPAPEPDDPLAKLIDANREAAVE